MSDPTSSAPQGRRPGDTPPRERGVLPRGASANPARYPLAGPPTNGLAHALVSAATPHEAMASPTPPAGETLSISEATMNAALTHQAVYPGGAMPPANGNSPHNSPQGASSYATPPRVSPTADTAVMPALIAGPANSALTNGANHSPGNTTPAANIAQMLPPEPEASAYAFAAVGGGHGLAGHLNGPMPYAVPVGQDLASLPALGVHPTATIDPTAVLGANCRVGPHAWVGPGVRLGEGVVLDHHACVEGRPNILTALGDHCRVGAYALVGAGVRMGRANLLHHHATVQGDTLMGDANEVFPHAVIGGVPQDILYKPGQISQLEIGHANVFRESVTVNRGTYKENGLTRIGSRNLLLAGSHVGHDSILEDGVILVNGVLLGGHVKIETGAIIGGATPLPPFLTVGHYAYVGGFSRATRDAPPFMKYEGVPARVTGLNKVGLKRAGFSTGAIAALESACRLLFSPARKQNMTSVIAALEADGNLTPEVRTLLDFLRASDAGRDGRAREVIHQKWHPRDRA